MCFNPNFKIEAILNLDFLGIFAFYAFDWWIGIYKCYQNTLIITTVS